MALPARYFEALWDAGAMPVLLPCDADWKRIEEYADRFAGFLFSGGGDVDPKYYGEEPSPKLGEVSEERDRFELALLSSVMIREKPVFGICRGEQLLNVGLGGSLFQHIEGHARTSPEGPWIWHGVITAASRELTRREMIELAATRICAAQLSGSSPRCGVAPWALLPFTSM